VRIECKPWAGHFKLQFTPVRDSAGVCARNMSLLTLIYITITNGLLSMWYASIHLLSSMLACRASQPAPIHAFVAPPR
jgi:hypothetical protein